MTNTGPYQAGERPSAEPEFPPPSAAPPAYGAAPASVGGEATDNAMGSTSVDPNYIPPPQYNTVFSKIPTSYIPGIGALQRSATSRNVPAIDDGDNVPAGPPKPEVKYSTDDLELYPMTGTECCFWGPACCAIWCSIIPIFVMACTLLARSKVHIGAASTATAVCTAAGDTQTGIITILGAGSILTSIVLGILLVFAISCLDEGNVCFQIICGLGACVCGCALVPIGIALSVGSPVLMGYSLRLALSKTLYGCNPVLIALNCILMVGWAGWLVYSTCRKWGHQKGMCLEICPRDPNVIYGEPPQNDAAAAGQV